MKAYFNSKLITIFSMIGTLLVIFLLACSSVPVTGRQQLSLISDESMHATSFKQYNEFLKENPPVLKGYEQEMVKRVGHKIQKGVEEYLAKKGQSSLLNGYNWEFNLVKDDIVNAWCMPGGKVVVYTGLLPVAKNEEGLAVVMGHEIAHAIARHGAERMSQQLALNMGGALFSVAMKNKPKKTQQMWASVYGVGSQVGLILPYSRLHESEADHLGLIFMALAGYNPNVAVSFWERMSQAGGQKPPQILSTHPSDETRISNIKKWMPEAMEYYKK